MVKIYVRKIKAGQMTLDDVPARWHDASYATKHSEVLVTNIKWEGTQNVY